MDLKKEDFGIFRAGYEEQAASGFRPRVDNQPIRLVPPLDWDMDPFHDRNWRFQLHAWRMLDPVWGEFYDVDWNRLRAEVMPLVRDWHDYHIVDGRVSDFSWYDMSAGFRAQHLALLAFLHHKSLMPLAPEDFAIVRRLSEAHVERLRDPDYIAMNNHGLFQLKGLRLLGAVWEGEDFCRGELEYSSLMMAKLINSQFDSYGVHVENSPDYHGFILKQFSSIRPELFPAIADTLSDILSKALEVLPWFTFPDRTVAAIGDSAGTSTPLPSNAKPDSVLETEEAGPILIRDLSASGYVVVRSPRKTEAGKASMMVIKGQTKSDGHAHADQLSLILYRAGRHLLADSGKYSYNRDAWRDYFVSDRAHNVVGLAGHSFGPQDTSTGGSSLSSVEVVDGAVVVEGSVGRRKFFKHRRRIVYRPEESIEIEDRIQARAKDAPVVYWHLGEGIDAEKINDGVELFDNGQRLARISVSDSEIRARIVRGQEKPRIQGWASPSYKQKVASTVVEYRAPAGHSRIDTRIDLFKPNAPRKDAVPRRLCHGIGFRFEYEFVSDRVNVLPDGRTVREVIVEIAVASAKGAGKKVADALVAKGFTILESRTTDGVSILLFGHEDRTQATLHMLAPEQGKVELKLSWQRIPLKPVVAAEAR